MRKIACLPDDDRRELFRNTADKMGLNDAIVEKDFWVCFTLDYLFHRCPWKDSITFKENWNPGKNDPIQNRMHLIKKLITGLRFFLQNSSVLP